MFKVAFLDRDGVINKYPGDREYVKSRDEFSFLPGAVDAVKKLKESNYKVFVISNQAGVSKGVYSKEELDLITRKMEDGFQQKGFKIDGVYYCIHKSDANCSCRKPEAGLLDLALSSLRISYEDLDLSVSYFIGDSIVDVKTGKARGLKTILVLSGREKIENKPVWEMLPDYIVGNLQEAVGLVTA